MSKYRQHIRDNIEAFMIFVFNCEWVYPFDLMEKINPFLDMLGTMKQIVIQAITPIFEIFGTLLGGINDKEYIQSEFNKLNLDGDIDE